MDATFHAGLVVLAVLYTALLMAYAKIFAAGATGLAYYVRPLLTITVVFHLATMLVRGFAVDACPMGRPAEFLSLVAFAIATIYLILEWVRGDRVTGVFVLVLAFSLQMIAAVTIVFTSDAGSYPRGAIPSLHVSSAIVGFSGVAVSTVYGLLYLFLYREIKRGSFGLFYRKMPSLERLSDLNYTATWIAFTALSVTVGLGVYLWRAADPGSSLHASLILTGILWVLYGACILGRRFWSIGGKRLAYTTVLGFLCVVGVLITGLWSKEFYG